MIMDAGKIKVLLLEDDANLGMVLQEHLQMQGYDVRLCGDGEQGLAAWSEGRYDLCLVDIMMPKKDGFTFAREIRSKDQETPLIFLTAKSMKEDKIQGFKVGCDDYVTKPFSIEELTLRIEAVLRRSRPELQTTEISHFRIGSYTLDCKKRQLTRGKHQQRLTAKETELMQILCLKLNKTVLREEALRQVWNDDSYFAGRSMDVFVSKLRKYLKDDPAVEIVNVHGKGFRLVVS